VGALVPGEIVVASGFEAGDDALKDVDFGGREAGWVGVTFAVNLVSFGSLMVGGGARGSGESYLSSLP
jgi:hypothetical protein